MNSTTPHSPHLADRTAGRSRPSAQVRPLAADAATRLISETAHDLRSPLAAVRESIRLVHDGDFGPVNDEQRELLEGAIGQCDCIDHLVSEMLQLDRLQNGMPRVRRDWVRLPEVRHAVNETLRPFALPRSVGIAWDGADDTQQRVYADVAALRRLIVNLVVNAVRVTADGGEVLISLTPLRGGEAIRWSVIDRGRGISESELKQIASRQTSRSGGEGLGLMICRQLAAAHFSPLVIRSRAGSGTEVSFETPAGSARSVTSCWSRWRNRFVRRSHLQLRGSLALIEPGTSQVRPPRNARLDPPSVCVELCCDGKSPNSMNDFLMGSVTLGAAMPKRSADQFDVLLQNQMRTFDFAYRVHARRWIWILDADDATAETRVKAIDAMANDSIENLRIDWGAGQRLPVNRRRTTVLLSDRMVRETLAAHPGMMLQDQDEVRMGTPPMHESPTAAARLERELHRLGSRPRG